MMKKALTLVLAGVTALSLTACGGGASAPEAFDPRAYLKAALAASVEMCKSRYIAFGCEGQASKIKPLPLSEMARLYSEGVLRQKVNG